MKRTRFLILVCLCVVCVFGCSKPAEGTKEGQKATLSMFVDAPWWPYNNWDGDMPKWFTEKTGIYFDVSLATNDTELALLVASGTTADVVVTGQFNLMSSPSVSYEWDELIEKHKINWAVHPSYKIVNEAADGKVYTIMVGYSADYEYEQYPTVNAEGTSSALRTDIRDAVLKKTGLENIKTLEDFDACLGASQELYPDVVPLIFNNAVGSWNWFQTMYGAAKSGFVTRNNKSLLWIYDENQKPALLKMNEWFRKGYIVAENLSWTGYGTALEWAAGGKCFAILGVAQLATTAERACKEAGVDYHWMPLDAIYTPAAAEIKTDTGWRGFFITKNCSNTEAALRAARFIYSKDDGYAMRWGIEGEDWEWNADHTEAIMKYDANDLAFFAKRQLFWGWLGHDGISNNMAYMGDPLTRIGLDWVGKITVRDPVQGIIRNRMDSDSDEFVIFQNIVELERSYIPRIILANTAQEAESLFNEMIKIADDLGGRKLNDWANTLFPDLNARYEAVRHIGQEGWEK
jgi:putative aldouronate transport system substrate-binding protein